MSAETSFYLQVPENELDDIQQRTSCANRTKKIKGIHDLRTDIALYCALL